MRHPPACQVLTGGDGLFGLSVAGAIVGVVLGCVTVWSRPLVTPLTEAGPKARDALLDLYANLGVLRELERRLGD